MMMSIEKEDEKQSRSCTTRVLLPATTESNHGRRRTRSAKASMNTGGNGPPPTKKLKTKSALPSTIDAMPTTTIELAGDASTQKCSYHDCPNRAKVIQSYGVFCNRHAVVFPCGFPGCRDKAPTNGTRCAKHAEQGTAMLDEALAVRSQSIPVCRTKGCFKNDQGRGYCRGHEKLMMATGQLPHAINKRRLNSAYTMCCYPGCGKHSQRNHLCRIHGNELIKQAQQMVDSKQSSQSFDEILSLLQKELRQCQHPDCEKNAQRDRLCTTHFHLRGQAEKGLDHKLNGFHPSSSSSDVKEKVIKFCSEEKCTYPVYCNWLCQQHYEQREKKGKASTALKSSKDGIHRTKSKGSDDYIHLSPPSLPNGSNGTTSNAASMVDLLYPQKDPLYSDLNLDDTSFGSKRTEEKQSSASYSGYTRPFNRLSFDYEPSASFLQDSTLYPQPRTTTCTNSTCNREVLGKGLCEVCLGVPSHVNFSEPSNAFTWNHHHSTTSSTSATSNPFYTYNDTNLREPSKFPSFGSYYEQTSKQRQCNFGGCRVLSKAPLCLLHASATLCSTPGCQELVVTTGFCTLHTLQNQCAVDGCQQLVMGSNPLTCLNHDTTPRCSHTQCFKFVIKDSIHCGLHQDGNTPCTLCTLYDMVCPLQNQPHTKENHLINSNVHKLTI